MKPLRLSEVAALVGGELVGDADPEIRGAAGVEDAGEGDLTFVAKAARMADLAASSASAVLLGPDLAPDRPAVRCSDPKRAFATILARLLPDLDRIFPPGIHPTAVIDPEAEVDAASVGPFCVIGAGARVATGTRLGPHVVLGPDVTVGRDCLIHAMVTVREGCEIGRDVVLNAGVVIGTDGFGFLPGKSGLERMPQVGKVVIEDGAELGAGTCVDRATTGTTVVGAGSKIDNLVQIGHNVKVGRHCALSAQTGISGSCVLGDGVTTGGQVGMGDHVKIGDGVMIGGQSGIVGDIEPGATLFGTPALDRSETFRIVAAMRKLPDLLRRVAKLERGADRE